MKLFLPGSSLLLGCSKAWRNQGKLYKAYWSLYGGWSGLFCSPHLHVSIALALVCWFTSGGTKNLVTNAQSILPNLLGFTIGAMAIVLAVASSSVFTFLSQKGNPASFFMKMTANFVHYITVQVVCLTLAIVFAGTESNVAGFVVGVLMFYAILVSAAVGIQLFQMARIYNAHASLAPSTPKQVRRKHTYFRRHLKR